MLTLSRAMVGHVEVICQMLFGHVIGFASQSAFPQKHEDSNGFWRAPLCWIYLGLKRKGQHFGPKLWPSLAGHFAPRQGIWKLQLCFLGAKPGDFARKVSYREVMFKLCWAMLYDVEARCQILFGHVVSFAFKNVPPSRTKIFSGFLRAVLAPFGVKLVPSWSHLRRFGAVLEAIWGHFGPCCEGRVKNNPGTHLRNKMKSRTVLKHKNAAKTLTCTAVNAKTTQKSFQNPPSKRSPQWPCSPNLSPGRQNKAPPSRAI